MTPSRGSLIAGKFRLDGPLANGGMGSVWVAFNEQLEVPVAIKFMAPALVGSPELVARFEREAKAAAQLRTPYVVQIFEHGIDRGLPFIAMELLEGEDLGTRLQRVHRISLQETAAIVSDVCKALRRAHEKGVVHRDLKPANIFLCSQDEYEVAKLLDFGIAKSLAAGVLEETQVDTIIGSPNYMSPEQARRANRAVDHRSDLWALGIIAYRCLTDRLPFSGDGMIDTLVRVCTDHAVPPSSMVEGLGPEVDRFFVRALARDPDERFQTARELADALCALAGHPQRGSSLFESTSVSAFPPELGSESHVANGSALASRSPSPSPRALASRSPSPSPRAPSPSPRAPSPSPRAPSPAPRAPSPAPRAPSPAPRALASRSPSPMQTLSDDPETVRVQSTATRLSTVDDSLWASFVGADVAPLAVVPPPDPSRAAADSRIARSPSATEVSLDLDFDLDLALRSARGAALDLDSPLRSSPDAATSASEPTRKLGPATPRAALSIATMPRGSKDDALQLLSSVTPVGCTLDGASELRPDERPTAPRSRSRVVLLSALCAVLVVAAIAAPAWLTRPSRHAASVGAHADTVGGTRPRDTDASNAAASVGVAPAVSDVEAVLGAEPSEGVPKSKEEVAKGEGARLAAGSSAQGLSPRRPPAAPVSGNSTAAVSGRPVPTPGARARSAPAASGQPSSGYLGKPKF